MATAAAGTGSDQKDDENDNGKPRKDTEGDSSSGSDDTVVGSDKGETDKGDKVRRMQVNQADQRNQKNHQKWSRRVKWKKHYVILDIKLGRKKRS